jgi:hypothetical protein
MAQFHHHWLPFVFIVLMSMLVAAAAADDPPKDPKQPPPATVVKEDEKGGILRALLSPNSAKANNSDPAAQKPQPADDKPAVFDAAFG